MSEVIGISGNKHIIQCITRIRAAVRPESRERAGAPWWPRLGPGILTQIYDGIQRPLPALAAASETSSAEVCS